MVLAGVDAGGGDRLALAVLVQYRMATTEQVHLMCSPGVRIEQTRRHLAKLRGEGLVDRVTLPQAGRTRVWFPTMYGVQVVSQWPELRGRRASKTVSDRTAVRLRVGHGLTVTETGLAFVQDARARGDVCRPLDWIPEVHHPLGGGEARPSSPTHCCTTVAAARATTGRCCARSSKSTGPPWDRNAWPRNSPRMPACTPTHRSRSGGARRRRRSWRGRSGGGPTRCSLGCCSSWTAPAPPVSPPVIDALRAAATQPAVAAFLADIPILAAPLVDVLQHGPSGAVWHPVRDAGQDRTISWMDQILAREL